ncbi:uncharacterized protein K452DRAFT_295686 [Aplosporella prunicola CBS 121167]|uniref:Uncharacterized protein n=1 Tax=Aplosporella prunicola CBS 121167 TaxID=1176127 RepID=A0A6A6BPE4_9PEZI|nr:uncharacterized protein K452DRAFT_295686 [Aplosporella prunicola CBS 121167]KAF2145145.1 hypothetical protein K452DRAFT_295686 [Aplosporella prunicola CBS 121167]
MRAATTTKTTTTKPALKKPAAATPLKSCLKKASTPSAAGDDTHFDWFTPSIIINSRRWTRYFDASTPFGRPSFHPPRSFICLTQLRVANVVDFLVPGLAATTLIYPTDSRIHYNFLETFALIPGTLAPWHPGNLLFFLSTLMESHWSDLPSSRTLQTAGPYHFDLGGTPLERPSPDPANRWSHYFDPDGTPLERPSITLDPANCRSLDSGFWISGF